jgi:hypothetical protein
MNIFVHKDGLRAGPFSLEQLKQEILAKRLALENMAWTEGQNEWKPISQIPHVLDKIIPPSPGESPAGIPSDLLQPLKTSLWPVLRDSVAILIVNAIAGTVSTLFHLGSTPPTSEIVVAYLITTAWGFFVVAFRPGSSWRYLVSVSVSIWLLNGLVLLFMDFDLKEWFYNLLLTLGCMVPASFIAKKLMAKRVVQLAP